jgi:hypothetical protein
MHRLRLKLGPDAILYDKRWPDGVRSSCEGCPQYDQYFLSRLGELTTGDREQGREKRGSMMARDEISRVEKLFCSTKSATFSSWPTSLS